MDIKSESRESVFSAALVMSGNLRSERMVSFLISGVAASVIIAKSGRLRSVSYIALLVVRGTFPKPSIVVRQENAPFTVSEPCAPSAANMSQPSAMKKRA